MKKILFVSIVILVITTSTIYAYTSSSSNYNFPPLKMLPEYKEIVENHRNIYTESGYDYTRNAMEYDTTEDYLNYSIKNFKESERLQFDKNGIPKLKYGSEFYYNPVTVSQYALSLYSKYQKGVEVELDNFIQAADTLMTLADEEGAYRYPFPFKYYINGEVFEPGWVSGMAQGQVLSVYARAYHLTQNEKYLEYGNKAFQFMIKSVEEGGTLSTLKDLDPSLDEFIFFEEYVAFPSTYTLNGYMFAILGIYDWSVVSGNKNAENYFVKSIETLKVILPYYDIGGFSAYDLGHITYENKQPHIAARYHAVHLYLLNAIYSITDDVYFDYIKRVWASYVDLKDTGTGNKVGK
jgi:heparosan-N-sulfate-glucuronate 5-epimerase